MHRRVLAAALAAALVVTPFAAGTAHAQFGPLNIPGITVPAQQNQANNVNAPKSMGQMLTEREQRQAQIARRNQRSSIIGGLVGIVGAAACGAFRNDVSQERQIACAAAGALLGYGTYLLSNEIARRLEANDQRRLLVAASESLRTGEPAALDFPDSSASGTVTPVGNRRTQEGDVDVFYDSSRVTNLSNISVIAQPVSWNRQLAVRDTPATTGRSTGNIPANTVFFISGQVPDSNWYMVSQRVREEASNSEAYMVVGYVTMSEVRAAAPDTVLAPMPVPATLAEGRVHVTMPCDELAFEVRNERGQTSRDTSARCRGPDGNLLSA